MADRIKGITIVIGGDTTGLSQKIFGSNNVQQIRIVKFQENMLSAHIPSFFQDDFFPAPNHCEHDNLPETDFLVLFSDSELAFLYSSCYSLINIITKEVNPMGFIQEFKKFALKGNMMDLAVGVIIGGAFNGLVTALVDNVIMPVVSLFTGKIDFNNLFIALDGGQYATIEAAQAAGVSVLGYGSFITALINFLIMALVVFFLVKGLNAIYHEKPAAPAAPATKKCPFCQTEIDIHATR